MNELLISLVVSTISNVKQFFKSIFVRDKKGFDTSWLIMYGLMILSLQSDFIKFGQFSKWYLNLSYFLFIVFIFIIIFSLLEKILSKILGKYNKPVKLRYLFIVCLVTSLITTYFS